MTRADGRSHMSAQGVAASVRVMPHAAEPIGRSKYCI